MTQSLDKRGIDVALLYRPETFKLIDCENIRPKSDSGTPLGTRDFLHVVGRVLTQDTLHVFVCHLSSKVGGKQGLVNRKTESRRLQEEVRKVIAHQPNAKVVIVGDFNDSPKNVSNYLGVEANPERTEGIIGDRLYNLSWNDRRPKDTIDGTYKYDGHWEMIDQCIVSGTLLHSESAFSMVHPVVHVCAPKFVLKKDDEDGGFKPMSTYENYKYVGGYSDHLPIAMTFMMQFSW